jgi:hypothetical protein
MAFLTKKHLSRRTFLNGVGVTLAVPFLESMIPARALGQSAAASPRTRFGCIYFPHGAIMPKWTPAAEGAGFELSEILQPLKPFYSQITVISDLRHANAYGSGATANHNRSAAAFLSGAFAKVGAQPELGITVDQIAARHIGQDTPLPSLELMIEGSSLNCGDGLSCSYRDTISWQGPTSPLPMQNNPQVVFERLFGDGNTAELRKARRQQSLSLLDSVMGEAASLQRKLPQGDRQRLDQYLTDVREIERRIERAGQQLSDDLAVPPAPTGIPRDVEEHIKLMYDLQVLAWQAEITRVSTFLEGAEHRRLSQERRSRRVPHALAPLQRPGEQGPFRGAQSVSRRLVHVLPGKAEGNPRRRRHAARSFAGALWQRHERREPAQSHGPSDHPRRRRVGSAQGRPARPQPEEHPDGEPARLDDPETRSARGQVRRQYGRRGDLRRPTPLAHLVRSVLAPAAVRGA